MNRAPSEPQPVSGLEHDGLENRQSSVGLIDYGGYLLRGGTDDGLGGRAHGEFPTRLLKASAEGFALFHLDPELAREVMARWNGIMGDERGETIYDRGD